MIYKDGYFFALARDTPPAGSGWERLGALRVDGSIHSMFWRRAPLTERVAIFVIDKIGEWLSPSGPG